VFNLYIKGELYEARKESTKHKPGQSTKPERSTPKRRMDKEQTKNAQPPKKIKIIQEKKGKRGQEVIQEVCCPL
jgi:hypothetical protein